MAVLHPPGRSLPDTSGMPREDDLVITVLFRLGGLELDALETIGVSAEPTAMGRKAQTFLHHLPDEYLGESSDDLRHR